MSWRAFFIGLFLVAVIAAVTPYNDFALGNTYITGMHFPPGPFFLLLLLTLIVNVFIKLIKSSWALRQAELMLIWCMMIVAATVPASGLTRYWFPILAAPAYYANSPDLPNQDEVLEAVPDALVLSKSARSIPVKQYFEGAPQGEKVKVYLRQWSRPIAVWGVFIAFFYVASLLLASIFRKQWVDKERLIFPLARVPLELTEGSGGKNLLPPLLRERAFLVGLVLTLVFALIRVAPVIMGKEQGWLPTIPVGNILANTPFQNISGFSARLFPLAVGIAFLVPTDVSLSVWLFFFFIRAEIQISFWVGRPIEGGTWGEWMQWQQAGAFLGFVPALLWSTRRHLAAVAKKALGIGRDIDDSAEPVSYALSFWGLLLAMVGMIVWFAHFGMKPLTATILVLLVMCVLLVHARLVSQGGIFLVQHSFLVPSIIHGISGGSAFGPSAAVVAQMQNAILIQDSREILSAHAMNAFRISSVFTKHRRWFLPIMLISLVVAVSVCTRATLYTYYEKGGLNIHDTYGTIGLPIQIFGSAGRMINDPTGSAKAQWGPFLMGGGIMALLTFMRARFYWWPVHSLGFLVGNSYPIWMLWFSFLLAWGAKVMVTKIGGAAMLRKARQFFLGVIIGEAIAIGVTTMIGLITHVKFGTIFLPG